MFFDNSSAIGLKVVELIGLSEDFRLAHLVTREKRLDGVHATWWAYLKEKFVNVRSAALEAFRRRALEFAVSQNPHSRIDRIMREFSLERRGRRVGFSQDDRIAAIRLYDQAVAFKADLEAETGNYQGKDGAFFLRCLRALREEVRIDPSDEGYADTVQLVKDLHFHSPRRLAQVVEVLSTKF